jgi:hypothetical protein
VPGCLFLFMVVLDDSLYLSSHFHLPLFSSVCEKVWVEQLQHSFRFLFHVSHFVPDIYSCFSCISSYAFMAYFLHYNDILSGISVSDITLLSSW